MCELSGLSADTLSDISFSFSGLKQRGGNTGEHKGGWGSVYTKVVAVEPFMNLSRVFPEHLNKKQDYHRSYPAGQ